jgi:hypothetical protein
MDERQVINEKAKGFFDDIWRNGDFSWLETSELERGNTHARSICLEIGDGPGCHPGYGSDLNSAATLGLTLASFQMLAT